MSDPLTKDRAVCIRTVDYSETSQIVTLFARLTGKVAAIAKGSKRPKSAFDGPIEVLSYGDVVFTDTHQEKLATLTEFQLRPAAAALRRNLFALNAGLFAAELVAQLTHDGDPHPVLFDHLVQFLTDIAADGKGQRRDVLVRLILFQLALLQEVGLRPNFKNCTNCKRAYASDWRQTYFSSSANGLVCRDCEMSFPDKIQLGRQITSCLINLREIAEAGERTIDEIEGLLIHHFTETLGHRPRLAKYILGPGN